MQKNYSERDMRLCLQSLGVKNGDCLFIHTALKGLGKFTPHIEGNALEVMLDVFTETVGEAGTIVVPTFNFAFCKGEAFDLQNTPCNRMGAFSEFVRKKTTAKRSRHPFHSVAAIGRKAFDIANAEAKSEFADGSSFDVMLKLNCKILFFGIDFVETFVHVAEERAEVPYRFWKTFTGDFIKGNEKKRITVNFYARKLDAEPEPVLDVDKINKYLRSRGIIKSADLGSGRVSICNGSEMVNELTKKFKEEPLFSLKEF